MLKPRTPDGSAHPSRLRHWLLPAAAALLALLLAHGHAVHHLGGPSDRYHTDGPGDLAFAVQTGAVEIAVLYLVLRPWSYHRSWARAACAWLLFLPWVLLQGVVGMHVGPTLGGHVSWMMIVEAGLFVTTIVSAVARTRSGPPERAGPGLQGARSSKVDEALLAFAQAKRPRP